MHAGMISKISDENQKLPLANRLAYRRFILEVCLIVIARTELLTAIPSPDQRCAGVKETVREFEEYIEEYREAAEAETVASEGDSATETVFRAAQQLSLSEKTGKSEEEDGDDEDKFGDDDDDDDEDTQYSSAEVAVVVSSVALMRLTLDCTKAVLGAVSTASDSIVTALADEGLCAEESSALQLLEGRSQVWVGALARCCDTLQSRTVDLGAELYPPLEDQVVIATMYNALLESVQQTLDLLLAVEFAPHLTTEVVVAVENLRLSIPSPRVVSE